MSLHYNCFFITDEVISRYNNLGENNCEVKGNNKSPGAEATHLRALSDRLVIEVQEARSRCFSFGQNLLRLLHVLQRREMIDL